MQNHITVNAIARQQCDNPCLVCGGVILEKKPARRLTRKVCGPACQRLYQVGENNPKWRGGEAVKACLHCGGEMTVPHAKRETAVYCGRDCQRKHYSTRFAGAANYAWDASPAAERKRQRRRSAARRVKVSESDGLLTLPEGVRPDADRHNSQPCKGCGCHWGVKKGRSYHACCHLAPKTKLTELTCSKCGLVRWGHVAQGEEHPLCKTCSLRSRHGERNANWRGGISSENQRIRRSDEYKAWRKAVYERDSYTCVECGRRGGPLHADHIKPFCAYPELRLAISNGRTLCVPCHEKTDTYLSGALKYLKARDLEEVMAQEGVS